MEASQISRLREEQQKAVSETEEKIGQLEKYKADYKTLQERLETLPDKVTHDVMVPFGKLAFMPGQLVHTNEILVLLGDNWFAERSAKQARDIAGRRISELDTRIKELKEQKSLLNPRLGLTSELEAVAEGRGDYTEITEEYDEEKERLWDEQHKINVRRHHEKMKTQRNGGNSNDDDNERLSKTKDQTSDDDLWSRLDALEKQEEERGELDSSFDSDNGKEEDGCRLDGSGHERKVSDSGMDKTVTWKDEERDKSDNSSDADEDEDDYDNDEDSDNGNDNSRPIVKTITFHHSKTPLITPHQEPSASQDSVITSPGEIYKLFCPKPILKKTPESRSSVDQGVRFPDMTGDHSQADDTRGKSSKVHPIDTSKDKAFSGIVKENAASSQPPLSTTSTTSKQDQPKRVSKFRAQRMAQNP